MAHGTRRQMIGGQNPIPQRTKRGLEECKQALRNQDY